jgi:hypothetical protein
MTSDAVIITVATVPVIVTSISTIAGVRMTLKTEAARDEARLREERARFEATLREERLHRNHDERRRTAAEYLTAYDDFRRAVRLGQEDLGDQDAKARTLANVAGRVELYFDARVIANMREAESEIVAKHRSNRELSPEPDGEPVKDAERRLIAAMKQQLES